jgi:hypothetical protein
VVVVIVVVDSFQLELEGSQVISGHSIRVLAYYIDLQGGLGAPVQLFHEGYIGYAATVSFIRIH